MAGLDIHGSPEVPGSGAQPENHQCGAACAREHPLADRCALRGWATLRLPTCATGLPARTHPGLAGVLTGSFGELAKEEGLGMIWGPVSLLRASGQLPQKIPATRLKGPFFSECPAM